jgi:hypothetical protein
VTLRARFIGDPRHGGEGPSSFPFGGVVFVKGEWLSDIPEAIASKVRGNSHFETEDAAEKPAKIIPLDLDGDGKPGGSLPDAESPDAAEIAKLRADLTDLGASFHHKAGAKKLRELLDAALEA